MVGELRFPEIDGSYPTLQQFEALFQADAALSQINYKLRNYDWDYYFLAGIQLVFDSNNQSPLF